MDSWNYRRRPVVRAWGRKPGKALGEKAARTFGRRAEETANHDVDPTGSTKTREVAKLARIPTTDAKGFRVPEEAKLPGQLSGVCRQARKSRGSENLRQASQCWLGDATYTIEFH